MVEQRLASIEAGQQLAGVLMARHHVGTAAIFLRGGSTFTADSVSDERLERADDCWPDILLLLEPGRLILKTYEPEGRLGGHGCIAFFDYGPDALCIRGAVLSLEVTAGNACKTTPRLSLFSAYEADCDEEANSLGAR
jgi:hypothetical protein